MMEQPNNLSFATLRAANVLRLPQFKTAKGDPTHSMPDGSDWTPGEWANAVLGELGEAANIIKKVRRGDFALIDAIPAGHAQYGTCATYGEWLGAELADTVTYLDILAFQVGVDLGQAVEDKFNLVSERVGADVYILNDTEILRGDR